MPKATKFDTTLPPIRAIQAEVDAYRRRCEDKGMSLSEGIRRHMRREGRKAKKPAKK